MLNSMFWPFHPPQPPECMTMFCAKRWYDWNINCMFLGYMTNESIILHVDLTLTNVVYHSMDFCLEHVYFTWVSLELFKYYPTTFFSSQGCPVYDGMYRLRSWPGLTLKEDFSILRDSWLNKGEIQYKTTCFIYSPRAHIQIIVRQWKAR